MTIQKLLIVSHNWKDRDQMSAVEQLCHELDEDFFKYNGARFLVGYKVGKLLIRFSNSRKSKKYTAPYNSHFAGEEFWGMWQIIKKRPKIVFFPYADYNYNYTWLLKRIFRFKLVLYTFFSEEELQMRFKSLSHFKKADVILVAGKGQMEYLKDHLPSKKLHFFPLPINTEFFKPADEFESFRLVQSGINRRDFKTLFAALDILHKKYPKLKVDFIGCKSISKNYLDKPYAVFHEYLNDLAMREVYQRAQLQLLIAEDGGSSNSLSEGLACGLPMVITNLANLRDYVNIYCSILVEKKNVSQIVSAVAEILEDDKLRLKMSNAARDKALEFSKQKLIERFNQVVENV